MGTKVQQWIRLNVNVAQMTGGSTLVIAERLSNLHMKSKEKLTKRSMILII